MKTFTTSVTDGKGTTITLVLDKVSYLQKENESMTKPHGCLTVRMIDGNGFCFNGEGNDELYEKLKTALEQ